MSLHIQIIYEKETDWVDLHLSGGYIEEIRRSGYWLGRKIDELKYPDGRIWLFASQSWDMRCVKKERSF